jgi:putative ABC transport system permease protein
MSGWSDLTGFEVDGRAQTTPDKQEVVQYRVIDFDYFRVMDTPLIRGKSFDDKNREGSDGVVIINDTMARRFWAGKDPVGQRIRTIFPHANAPWRPKAIDAWLTIIGIVEDVRDIGPTYESGPEIYLSYLQSPSPLMRLVIRPRIENTGLAPDIRRELLAVDKDQPVTEVKGNE